MVSKPQCYLLLWKFFYLHQLALENHAAPYQLKSAVTEAHGIAPNRLEAHRADCRRSKHTDSTQLDSRFSWCKSLLDMVTLGSITNAWTYWTRSMTVSALKIQNFCSLENIFSKTAHITQGECSWRAPAVYSAQFLASLPYSREIPTPYWLGGFINVVHSPSWVLHGNSSPQTPMTQVHLMLSSRSIWLTKMTQFLLNLLFNLWVKP